MPEWIIDESSLLGLVPVHKPPPDEEDAWYAEMQAAGVPKELWDDLVNLAKEVLGLFGAELWSDPKKQADLLIERLQHYLTGFQYFAASCDYPFKGVRDMSTAKTAEEIARQNALEGKC